TRNPELRPNPELGTRNPELRPNPELGTRNPELHPNPELGSRNPELHPDPELRPALSEPAALEKVGHGILQLIGEEEGIKTYGRAFTVAELLNGDRVLLSKWIRRLTNWSGRQAPLALWDEKIVPLIEKKFAAQKTPVVRFERQDHKIIALSSIADLPM